MGQQPLVLQLLVSGLNTVVMYVAIEVSLYKIILLTKRLLFFLVAATSGRYILVCESNPFSCHQSYHSISIPASCTFPSRASVPPVYPDHESRCRVLL